MSNTYLLAITCYNCAPQITRVLEKISSEIEGKMTQIMVIDNRSTDDLQQVVKAYIESQPETKVHLYENAENYSLGGSQKVAFLHGQKLGMTHVIILHGDDQADPRDILDLLNVVESGKASTVLGSRFSGGSKLIGYDWKRIFGNKVLNVLFTVVTGHRVKDLGSGLNVFALSDLDENRYLNFADRMTFNIELLLDLIDRKVDFTFCPITWREEDQVSNARNFNIAWTAFKNLTAWKFDRKRFFCGQHKASDYITIEVA